MNFKNKQKFKLIFTILLMSIFSIGILVSCTYKNNSSINILDKPQVNVTEPNLPAIGPDEAPIDNSFRFDYDGNYYYSDHSTIVDTVPRQKPDVVGSLPRYPAPTNNSLPLSVAEIDAIYEESNYLMNNVDFDIKNGTLKKHVAADGQFYGILPDDAQAVIKDVMIDTRRGGGRIIGYAPAGEIVKITLPEGVTADAFIGYEEPHFNIPRAKYGHNRMPILMKAFKLVGGANYIGTPFGGAITVFITANATKPFTLRVKGAVETPVFNYGIDTNQDWEKIKNNPGLTAEIYTRYARLVIPAYKLKDTVDMETIGKYWYNTGCLSTYATNQEISRSYPVTLNFDLYVAAGGAVNVGGKFTMQPLGAADYIANVDSLMYNNNWGNMHEYNHSFQNSGGVRWGIEATGEITNNALSVLEMILYTDIATKRTESNMGFREDTADPYNCFRNTMGYYNNDKITDYTQYWNEGGIHYSYYIFGDIAHAFGVDNMVKFIRSYGDGSCPVLPGFNSTVGANAPDTIIINRSDFALRAAKVLGYDMTYYLNVINKMKVPDPIINEIKAMNLPEFKPAANLYAYGRNDGITKSQTGRPFFIDLGVDYEFDFVGKTLSPDKTFVISKAPTAKLGTFTKQDNGKYKYVGNGLSENDPFSFEISYSDGQKIEFFGEIAFRANTLDIQVWNNLGLAPAGKEMLDKAIDIANNRAADQNLKFLNGIGIPSGNNNTNFYRQDGKFVAPQTAYYTFFPKVDDCGYFYLSSDSSKENLKIIVSAYQYTANYSTVKSDPIKLIKGQIYYFRFEVLNTGGATSGQIGYKINDLPPVNVPASCVYNAKLTDEQLQSLVTKTYYTKENIYLSPFAGVGMNEKISKGGFEVTSAPKHTNDTKYSNMIDNNERNWYFAIDKGEGIINLSFNRVVEFNKFSVVPNPLNNKADIKDYTIFYSNDGVNYTEILKGSTTDGRVDSIFGLIKATHFRLQVTAGVHPTNLSFAELNFYKIFDTRDGLKGIRNDQFTYSGKPNIETDGIYESNFLPQLTKDMTATATFSGKNLAIFAVKKPNAGKIEIIVDGISLGIIDLNNPTPLYRENIFFTSNLSLGPHTLVLKCVEGVANFDFIQVNNL